MAPEMHRIAPKNLKKPLHTLLGRKKGTANECEPERFSAATPPVKKQFRKGGGCVAMKAPVGLSSSGVVCVSRWRGFAPPNSAGVSELQIKNTLSALDAQSTRGGHSKPFYLPASRTASTAFWTWRRFSASSKISSACCSNRAVEISSPRWAGRQCSTSASGLAFSSRRPVS